MHHGLVQKVCKLKVSSEPATKDKENERIFTVGSLADLEIRVMRSCRASFWCQHLKTTIEEMQNDFQLEELNETDPVHTLVFYEKNKYLKLIPYVKPTMKKHNLKVVRDGYYLHRSYEAVLFDEAACKAIFKGDSILRMHFMEGLPPQQCEKNSLVVVAENSIHLFNGSQQLLCTISNIKVRAMDFETYDYLYLIRDKSDNMEILWYDRDDDGTVTERELDKTSFEKGCRFSALSLKLMFQGRVVEFPIT